MRITLSAARLHFHVLVLDGVFSEDGHGEVQFHEASRLGPDDWERLQATVQHRVLRDHLHTASGARRRHGLLDEDVTENMLTWQASGGLTRLRLASQPDARSLFDTASTGWVQDRRLRPHRGPRPPGHRAPRPLLRPPDLRPTSPPPSTQAPHPTPPHGATSTPRSARIRWAQLLARIYELLPLRRIEEVGIWALHVWIARHNPNGIFADWNPDVTCERA